MRPHRRTRSLAAAAATVVLLSGSPALAGSGSGDVRSARAQMAAMQAKVDAVAARLARGSRAYEEGLRHLSAVQRKERAARRAAEQLAGAAVAEQDALNQIASGAYRHPLPSTLTLAMASSGGQFTSALVAKADLEHVSGSQQEVLRKVVAARVRADHLTRTAEQLSAEARSTERRLSKQLRQLRETAAAADRELQAAARELAKAQAAERARQRAAAARATRARLARGGALCLGESTAGYANGFLPNSALCPLWDAPGHKLTAAAAGAFNRMSQAYAASHGRGLCVTDSYRSYSEQVSVYHRKPGLAATPGTSEHGYGKAVDLCGGVERFGSDAYRWMKANSGRFGWYHPGWAEPSGSKPEAWHWEYGG